MCKPRIQYYKPHARKANHSMSCWFERTLWAQVTELAKSAMDLKATLNIAPKLVEALQGIEKSIMDMEFPCFSKWAAIAEASEAISLLEESGSETMTEADSGLLHSLVDARNSLEKQFPDAASSFTQVAAFFAKQWLEGNGQGLVIEADDAKTPVASATAGDWARAGYVHPETCFCCAYLWPPCCTVWHEWHCPKDNLIWTCLFLLLAMDAVWQFKTIDDYSFFTVPWPFQHIEWDHVWMFISYVCILFMWIV